VNVRVERAGTFALFLSKDVPVTVTTGSRFGQGGPGQQVALKRAADGVRYDMDLASGDYTVELGPTSERFVTIALPQTADPVCFDKGFYDD
jgi:hypothetical protein